jgi:hypothetical protein
VVARRSRLAIGLLAFVTTSGIGACTDDEPGPPVDPPVDPAPSSPSGDPAPDPWYTFTPTPAPPGASPAPLDQPVELGQGGDDLVVTLTGTAFDPEFVTPERTFWMFLAIENRGERSWRSNPGGAVLRDELGGRFRSDPRPTPADLRSDAQAFGYGDADLARPVAVRPGETVEGAFLFRVPGAPREMILEVDLGPGVRAGFVTNFGLF